MKKKITYVELIIVIILVIISVKGWKFWNKTEETSRSVPVLSPTIANISTPVFIEEFTPLPTQAISKEFTPSPKEKPSVIPSPTLSEESSDLDIWEASVEGDVERVRQLIEENPEAVNLIHEDGIAPLHLAANFGHKEVVLLLIEKGADVNVRQGPSPPGFYYLSTPLHKAILSGHREIASILIQNGADINAEYNIRDYPDLDQPGNLDREIMFVREFNVNRDLGYISFTPLHLAVCLEDKEKVILLVENGAKVNSINNVGSTPLHYACCLQNKEILYFLLDNEADIHIKNDYGCPPLHFLLHGSQKEKKKLVDLFISKGADVNVRDKDGFNSLYYALSDEEIFAELIKKGADINAKNAQGKTLLELFEDINFPDEERIAFLRKYGAKRSSQL